MTVIDALTMHFPTNQPRENETEPFIPARGHILVQKKAPFGCSPGHMAVKLVQIVNGNKPSSQPEAGFFEIDQVGDNPSICFRGARRVFKKTADQDVFAIQRAVFQMLPMEATDQGSRFCEDVFDFGIGPPGRLAHIRFKGDALGDFPCHQDCLPNASHASFTVVENFRGR